ncbi:hypothetical protein SDC9_178258 [bioreactor metagenome]|uniref:Uncharacterized protein n=1 Tax=bioreactor metagenome TaxID=1076179 RepID=A0A645GVL4_9ZZZZ
MTDAAPVPGQEGDPERRRAAAIIEGDALAAALDFARRHCLADDHQVVQPAVAAEAGVERDAQRIGGSAQAAAGVFAGQVLDETLRRDARPFGENALEMGRAEADDGGQFGQRRLAARVAAQMDDGPGDDVVMAAGGGEIVHDVFSRRPMPVTSAVPASTVRPPTRVCQPTCSARKTTPQRTPNRGIR